MRSVIFASLLNLTPAVFDRLSNAYQRDLPRKVDFVGEVGRCKLGRALVDDKPERLLYMKQTVTFTRLYTSSSVSY